MKLNEFGDFLAGAFAPLAFFWFVIGYFQQGKELQLQREELRLTTDALQGQERELINQVKLNKKDLELKEAEATPRFKFNEINPINTVTGQIIYGLSFHNTGGVATAIECSSSNENIKVELIETTPKGQIKKISILEKGQKGNIRVLYRDDPSENFSITLTYQDRFGKKYMLSGPFSRSLHDWPDFFEKPVNISNRETGQ